MAYGKVMVFEKSICSGIEKRKMIGPKGKLE
jgi:hypothetical protein